MPRVTGGSDPSGNRGWIGEKEKIYQEAVTQGQIVLISEGLSVDSSLDDKWPVCACVYVCTCVGVCVCVRNTTLDHIHLSPSRAHP